VRLSESGTVSLGNMVDITWFVIVGLLVLVLTAWALRDRLRWKAAAGLSFAGCAVAIVAGQAWDDPRSVGQFLLIAIIGVPIFALADRYIGGRKKSARSS
jgi:peptidoglycan/LPS O-acetylase OafA/YrhL